MKIIGGRHRGRNLYSPKEKEVRPSTGKLRASLFNICGDLEGAHFLDLFAGGGAIGCEALSRGASHVIFVDKSKEAMRTIEKNLALLGEKEKATLLCMDTVSALQRLVKKKGKFHIIFADPPYGKGFSEEVLLFVDSHSLLEKGGRLFLEDLPSKTPPPLLHTLTLASTRKIGDTLLQEYLF